MQTTHRPAVHVTNYQQYINAGILTEAILERIPNVTELPETLYVSIAYLQINRIRSVYETILCLNIKGRAYRFKAAHDIAAYYTAIVALSYNVYSNQAAKDTDIRSLQLAFEAVVQKNIKRIVNAITAAYGTE